MHDQCKTVLHIHPMKIHQFAASPHFCMVIYFETTWTTWMNGGFLLDIGVKLFYTDDIFITSLI
jgi:hypothetical protein